MNTTDGLGRSVLAFSSLGLVVALAMTVMATVNEPFLGTWLALFFISCVPAQVLLGQWLELGFPRFIAQARQPTRGILCVLMCAGIGLAVTTLTHLFVGGGIAFPRPPVIHYSIVTVVLTFWFVIVWQCWPLSESARRPGWLALALAVVAYLIGYGLFSQLFSFEVMSDSDVYVASLDPKGLLPAWTVISFLVTTVAVIFALVLFDFWPVSALVRPTQPFLWGIACSSLIILITLAIHGTAIFYFHLDPVKYLVHGPVSFIFGVFVPLNLFEGKLLSGRQPLIRGSLLVLLSALSGLLLNRLYFGLSDVVAGTMASGAPSYELELWAANAMLAFSFPILVALTDHFRFWPLRSGSEE